MFDISLSNAHAAEKSNSQTLVDIEAWRLLWAWRHSSHKRKSTVKFMALSWLCSSGDTAGHERDEEWTMQKPYPSKATEPNKTWSIPPTSDQSNFATVASDQSTSSINSNKTHEMISHTFPSSKESADLVYIIFGRHQMSKGPRLLWQHLGFDQSFFCLYRLIKEISISFAVQIWHRRTL